MLAPKALMEEEGDRVEGGEGPEGIEGGGILLAGTETGGTKETKN